MLRSRPDCLLEFILSQCLTVYRKNRESKQVRLKVHVGLTFVP